MKATEADKRRQKRNYAEHVRLGICPSCTRPKMEGRIHCKVHVAKMLKAHKRRRRGLVRAGLCSECGLNPLAEQSKAKCEPCLAKVRGRASAEVCPSCNHRPAPEGFTVCQECRDNRRVHRDRRRVAGKCVSCGRRKSCEQDECGPCRRERRRRYHLKCRGCGGAKMRHRKMCDACFKKRAPAEVVAAAIIAADGRATIAAIIEAGGFVERTAWRGLAELRKAGRLVKLDSGTPAAVYALKGNR